MFIGKALLAIVSVEVIWYNQLVDQDADADAIVSTELFTSRYYDESNEADEPRLFGYAGSVILELKSDVCEEIFGAPSRLNQCLREARYQGDPRAITIIGTEFGNEGAAVLVGGKECVTYSQNNTHISCMLPELGLAHAEVIVIQDGGASAMGNASVSYELCLKGTKSLGEETVCVPCEAGKISVVDGADECKECNTRFEFQPENGTSFCLPCPFNAIATENHVDCTCETQHYAIPFGDYVLFESLDKGSFEIYMRSNYSMQGGMYNPHEELGYWCVECPWGANCSQTGNHIDTILPEIGFYMGLDGTGTAFFPCFNDACEGGQCSTGYTGSSCTTCGENLVLDQDFECQPCPSLGLSVTAIVVSLMALMGYLGYKMWAQSVQKSPSLSSVFYKIIVTTCQVNSIAAVYTFKWSEWMQRYLDLQDFLTSIGTAYFELSCFTDRASTNTFVLETVGYISFPFVVVLSTGITGYFVALRAQTRSPLPGMASPLHQAYGSAFSAGFLTLFLMQPSLVERFSLLFACVKMGAGEDDYFFLENLEMRCYTPEHNAVVYGLGLPLFVLYVCGIPICFARLLTKPSHRIMIKSVIISEESQTSASLNDENSLYAAAAARLSLNSEFRTFESSFGFLFLGYKEDYFMWELCIMVRKGLLCILGVTLNHDPRTQVKFLVLIYFG